MIERIDMKKKYKEMCCLRNELEAYICGVSKSFPDDPVISIPALIDEEKINSADYYCMREDMRKIGWLYDDFCLWLARKCKADHSWRDASLKCLIEAHDKFKKTEEIFMEIDCENEFRSIDKEVEKLDNVLKNIPSEELKTLWI
jgi:hypothetical protein